MRQFIIFSFFLLISNSVMANGIDIDSYKKCKSAASDADKIKCYDELYKEGAEIKKEKNNWVISTGESEVDDSKTVILYVDANKPVYTSLMGKTTPSLVLRCQHNKTEVYIQWGVYLGLDTTDIITRIDKEKAVEKAWAISTNNQTSFYIGTDVSFIKSLLNKNKLLAQVTPYGENPVQVSFNINGLNDELLPLRNACKW